MLLEQHLIGSYLRRKRSHHSSLVLAILKSLQSSSMTDLQAANSILSALMDAPLSSIRKGTREKKLEKE